MGRKKEASGTDSPAATGRFYPCLIEEPSLEASLEKARSRNKSCLCPFTVGVAAAAWFLGECLEKTSIAGSLCWCLSEAGRMGMVYSAMLPKFSGDRALDACPVKEGFLDQILGWGAGATCPRRAC